MFKAIYLTRSDQFRAELRDLDDTDLEANTPEADTTLEIDYSTINYKDGLALTNKSPVVRKWPMVPGIDCAGSVQAGTSSHVRVGDKVVLNGWGAGETVWGGLAQRGRYRGEQLVHLPAPLTTRDAMSIGTAGYTAMLAAMALADNGVTNGEVLVTGASGGVGSFAVAILAKRGHRVVASTGKLTEADYLRRLGASDVIDRAELSTAGKPLQKERWAGVIDSVGSQTLANACAQLRYGGVAVACGLAQGMDFPATVAPFILRGARLIGIDSVMCPMDRRTQAWQHLAQLDRAKLDAITREIPLADAFEAGRAILAGEIRGRVVVNVNA
jgi:acrylyl-CoA reductase (NADPH)